MIAGDDIMDDDVKLYAHDAEECTRRKRYFLTCTALVGGYGSGAALGEYHDSRCYGCGGAVGEGEADGVGDGTGQWCG